MKKTRRHWKEVNGSFHKHFGGRIFGSVVEGIQGWRWRIYKNGEMVQEKCCTSLLTAKMQCTKKAGEL